MAGEDEGGEKTEEPTQKKLDDALKRGDVAKSQELNTWFGMAAATLAVSIFGDGVASNLAHALRRFLAEPHLYAMDGGALIRMAGGLGLAIAAALALPMLALMAAAIVGNLAQHRFVFSTESLTPKLSKISPASGFKRLFSAESLVNFLKGLVKIGVVGAVITMIVWPARAQVASLVAADPAQMLGAIKALALRVLTSAAAVYAAVAIGDYIWQRRRWNERLRMSVQEIRDEHKQQEGDPHVKARIRQIRVERSRKRMMAQVPGATVVIANPTHYAVALKYEPGMNAPLCVAKGVDSVALRIRKVAEEAGVEVVENPPLARSLHAAIEIDREIPSEHYKAVAEVIGFVMRKKKRR
ncbi:flagellar biosynthesis protein FlhB [Methylopila jiangsuensis]|uniref:Flagellar biosynthetic protein FlhB n=1 Tax=Methylopila jiangsuensis TaxID=586230 RepID=A0A9W6JEW6_9HYPH|nr:flagellar biosynthesis protein FlhB [Methylopila jiangsuensis]MDR6284147.1 flagellar biosynthetic protein FlhB [Methylopila jiangsuensis]GLK76336.1 flagellar biosynthesis protein FlhB [Methylopila jiangsuensis]